MPIRVLVVDDHPLFRKGIVASLASREGVQVVGEASDGLEAIEMARAAVPDVILMDVKMPRCSGLEALHIIRQEMPQVQVIMLTIYDDDDTLFEALKNGAAGYLSKRLEPHELYVALDGTRRGEAAISGRLAARILEEFRRPKNIAQQPDPAEVLTPREMEVLQGVVKGDTNREIAGALNISENTVKMHVRNILEKLHLQNRVQVAAYGILKGLPSGTPPGE